MLMRRKEPIRGAEWTAVSLLAAVCVLLRLAPLRKVLVGGTFVFANPDAYYHLRRIKIFLHNFPNLPAIDPYMSFPYGAECPWPPLYDLFSAALAYLAGWGAPGESVVGGVQTFLPPLIAGGTVFTVFLLARRLAGNGAALVAALMFIVLPAHLKYSIVGVGDHHAAEVLLLVSVLLLFLKSIESEDMRKARRMAITSGVALSFAVLVWQGAIVYGVILAGGALGSWIYHSFRDGMDVSADRSRRLFTNAGLAICVATIVVGAARLLYPSETGQTRFDYGFFSWFQPIFLLAMALWVYLVAAFARRASHLHVDSSWKRLGVSLAGSVGPLLPILLVPWIRENVINGIAFVMTRDPWLQTIAEFQPTFRQPFFTGPSWQSYVEDGIYFLSFIMPMGLSAGLLVGRWRRGEPMLEATIFGFWSVLLGVMALRQERWGNLYSVNIAIGLGWFIGMAWSRFAAGRTRRFLAWGLSSILVLAFLYPHIFVVNDLLANPGNIIEPMTETPLAWLRDNLPKAGNSLDPREKPAYAVFSMWNIGHLVQYRSERPTIANNFGTQLRGNGMEDMLRVFLSPGEAGIVEVCSRRGIRFLIFTDVYWAMGSLAELIGVDFAKTYTASPVAGAPRSMAYPNKTYRALPYFRMYYCDGSSTSSDGAMTRFRMIYEYNSDSETDYRRGMGRVMIYEFVKGANVVGMTRPFQEVELKCRLKTNTGREFVYRNTARGDERGHFSIPFPYATRTSTYAISSLGPASIIAGTRVKQFDVQEDDVIDGKSISLGWI